jgi:transcriptional regulator with XRE-family HTH domain
MASARTRINRYEHGVRTPDPATVERIASELGLPAAYFYAVSDNEAEMLRLFHRLSEEDQEEVIEKLEGGEL